MHSLFKFPNPVNEYSARLVAGGVVCMCLAINLLELKWILWFLSYGFIARALTGPTLSPLGQLVTRLIIPNLKLRPKYVPGPPKRFAQSIGAVLSTAALIAWIAGSNTWSVILVSLVLFAATLESVFGFCIGCAIFGFLMKIRIIPNSVCEACVLPNYD